MNSLAKSGCIIAAVLLHVPAAGAEVPDAIAARGETHVATVHAQGAQVYECAPELVWKLSQPAQ